MRLAFAVAGAAILVASAWLYPGSFNGLSLIGWTFFALAILTPPAASRKTKEGRLMIYLLMAALLICAAFCIIAVIALVKTGEL